MLERVSSFPLKKFSNLWLSCIWLIAACILCWLNTHGQLNAVIACLTIIISLHGVFKSRQNIYLFIIYGFIFYSNYSICIANYIYPINSYFTSWANLPIAKEGLYVLLFFAFCLNCIVPTKQVTQPPALIAVNKRNIFIATTIWVILVCIGIFAFGRPEVIGDRGAPSPLYEYSTIFAILGIYYSGKIRWLHVLYIGVLLGFALQNFIFGGRVTGIQLLITIFLCFFNDKVKLTYLLPVIIGGLVLMSAIGQFRANLSLNADTLFAVLDHLKTSKMTLDTSFSSYFTSLTFLAMLGFMAWPQRLYLFSRFLIYIVGGGSVADANLAHFSRNYFLHYYGGVLPFFGYFYLGILGILLLTWYLHFLFKHIRNIDVNSSGLSRCLAIYITITVLRWYLYNPSQLFRGVLLLTVCYTLCYLFHRVSYRAVKLNL